MTDMEITARVWKLGDNINTDDIIPARYLNTADPVELARHFMEDIDPDFTERIGPGDAVIAGENFGCGSSREHAPIAIKAAGISCVIAKSFARIFYRNAINIGLPILECPEAAQGIKEGEQIRISLSRGDIESTTTMKRYKAKPFPAFMQQIIAAGGLMKWIMHKNRTPAPDTWNNEV